MVKKAFCSCAMGLSLYVGIIVNSLLYQYKASDKVVV